MLREHGIVLSGASPAEVVAPVAPSHLQREALSELVGLPQSLLAWLDLNVAWAQRYLVTMYCRVLFTLINGRVASKPEALRWAAGILDPTWRPLIVQTLEDRNRGLSFTDPPRRGSVESSLAFASYAREWATRHRSLTV